MTLPSNDSCEKKSFSRLSNNVIPRHYKLTINPDLKQFTFIGNEVIDVSIKEPTNSIQLNCLDIEVKSASFESNGRVITAKEWKQCDDTERVTIVFPSQLEAGEGKLSIDYVGVINDKLKGFYRSKYTTSDGEVRYSATTKFEPTHARRAFPCWDEPAVKATFDIILICPKDRLALSNMNVVAEEAHSDPNLKVVKFATSPVMSTYLVAFIVGEYDYVEDTTEDGIKVRVYTPVDRKEQGNFSLEVAVKCLPFYKKFFDVAYPLPKMDLIAIADFASGAMENWGLVTFRETCLLFDSKNTSASRKQWIAIVVAHELAHQWFGNLVTMEWWTHLWLNEGFATFMEFLCVASLYPQYDLWMQYVTDCVTVALSLDGLHNSHPVEVPVSHPSEITEIFDMISYKKGSSILGMLHNYVGNEIFSKSLSLYLKKHSYKNTVTEDLWDAIEEVSKKPIGNVMNTWTKQKGYPVINVTSRQDGNNRILTLKQEKFCANGKLSDVDKEALWLVPITIITQSNPEKDVKNFLFDSKTIEVVLENVASKDWVKLNRGCIGVYRVHYSQEMLKQFLPCIRDKSMPPLERLGLQNDLFAMVQEGRASTVDLLRLLEAYSDEDNYAVWDSIDSTLASLNSLLSHTDYQEHLHAFGRRLLAKIHSKLGWDAIENESHLDTMLRSLVLNRLIAFKEKSLLEEARRRFDAYVNGTYVIPADIRATVYRGAAANADDKTFDNFFALYRKADLHEEKNRIITSLAATNDPVKAQKVLDFSISEEVRTQDSVYVISAVSGSTVGRDLSWRFFQDNFKELSSRYDTGFMASHLVKCVTAGFASEDKALEIEEFFSKNPIPAAQRALQQSMESVRLKSEWLSRDTTDIKSYLIK